DVLLHLSSLADLASHRTGPDVAIAREKMIQLHLVARSQTCRLCDEAIAAAGNVLSSQVLRDTIEIRIHGVRDIDLGSPALFIGEPQVELLPGDLGEIYVLRRILLSRSLLGVRIVGRHARSELEREGRPGEGDGNADDAPGALRSHRRPRSGATLDARNPSL